jgi:hypothetical protein
MTAAATTDERRDAAMGALRRWVASTGRKMLPGDDALRYEIRTTWNHLWVDLAPGDMDELVALAKELGPHPTTHVQRRETAAAVELIRQRSPMSPDNLERALETFPSLTVDDLDYLRALAQEYRRGGAAA